MLKKNLPDNNVLMNTLRKTISSAWNIDNKVHKPSIEKWLDNFTGEALSDEYNKLDIAAKQEKNIALFMLCHFVFYNENEVKHLMRLLLEKYIHGCVTAQNLVSADENDVQKILNDTKFVPLGNNAESSAYLMYLFRQINDLSKSHFNTTATANKIVFIDDFSLTGSQAKSYLKKYINDNCVDLNSHQIFVLLLIATEEALAELRTINGITVYPCIILDEKAKAFSASSIIFHGYDDKIKQQAKKVCEFYGNKIVDPTSNVEALGFGNSAYLFGAYYNTPDNTLPIFWSELNGWKYFFKRYDKKYNRDGNVLGGAYV